MKIQDVMQRNKKELIDEKLLPTDLVFRYLDNQLIKNQIEQDYMSIQKK